MRTRAALLAAALCGTAVTVLTAPAASAAECVVLDRWHYVCSEDGEVCVFWSMPPHLCVKTGVNG